MSLAFKCALCVNSKCALILYLRTFTSAFGYGMYSQHFKSHIMLLHTHTCTPPTLTHTHTHTTLIYTPTHTHNTHTHTQTHTQTQHTHRHTHTHTHTHNTHQVLGSLVLLIPPSMGRDDLTNCMSIKNLLPSLLPLCSSLPLLSFLTKDLQQGVGKNKSYPPILLNGTPCSFIKWNKLTSTIN